MYARVVVSDPVAGKHVLGIKSDHLIEAKVATVKGTTVQRN